MTLTKAHRRNNATWAMRVILNRMMSRYPDAADYRPLVNHLYGRK